MCTKEDVHKGMISGQVPLLDLEKGWLSPPRKPLVLCPDEQYHLILPYAGYQAEMLLTLLSTRLCQSSCFMYVCIPELPQGT